MGHDQQPRRTGDPTADDDRILALTLGGTDPEPGVVTATNVAHITAGRARAVFFWASAVGSGDFLGARSATTSLRETSPGSGTASRAADGRDRAWGPAGCGAHARDSANPSPNAVRSHRGMALQEAVGPAQRCSRAGRQVDGHPRRQRPVRERGRGHARRRQATRQVAATNATMEPSWASSAPRSSARGRARCRPHRGQRHRRRHRSPAAAPRRPPPRRRGSTAVHRLGQHGVAHGLAVGAAERGGRHPGQRATPHPARHDRAATMGRWTTTALRRPGTGLWAAGGLAAVAYAWWAVGLAPFSAAATLAVVGAGVVAVAAGSRARRPGGGRWRPAGGAVDRPGRGGDHPAAGLVPAAAPPGPPDPQLAHQRAPRLAPGPGRRLRLLAGPGRGAGPAMTAPLTALAYALVALAAAGLELAARRRGAGRLADVLSTALRHPPVRVLVLAGWLWLGWHVFVRVDWR